MTKCKNRIKTDTRVATANWLRTSLAVLGVAAALGGVSPALAGGSSRGASVHKKGRLRIKETPVQKATTTMLENFAAQILADYHHSRVGAIECHPGVGYGTGLRNDEGFPGFSVSTLYFLNEGSVPLPSGPSLPKSSPNCKADQYGYELFTEIAVPGGKLVYPTPQEYPPPSQINLSNVTVVTIRGTMSSSRACDTRQLDYQAPNYYFYALGNGGDGSKHQKHQWDVSVEIDTLEGGVSEWHYTTGAGDLNTTGLNKKTPWSSLNMAELHALRGLTQTILSNAKQSSPTSIAGASEFPFPPTHVFPFAKPFTPGQSC